MRIMICRVFFVAFERFAHLEAAKLRHHDIEQNQVGLKFGHLRQRVIAVDGNERLAVKTIEIRLEQFDVREVIVGNQNFALRHNSSLRSGDVPPMASASRMSRYANGLADASGCSMPPLCRFGFGHECGAGFQPANSPAGWKPAPRNLFRAKSLGRRGFAACLHGEDQKVGKTCGGNDEGRHGLEFDQLAHQ